MKKDFRNYIYNSLHKIRDINKEYYPNMHSYYLEIYQFTSISVSTIRNFLKRKEYAISNDFLVKLNSFVFYSKTKQKSNSINNVDTDDLIDIIFIRLFDELISIILSDSQDLDTYKLFKKLIIISDSVNRSIKDITRYDFTEEILVNFLCGLYNDNDNYIKIKNKVLSYIFDVKISFYSYPYYYLFDNDMITKLGDIKKKKDVYLSNEFLYNTEKYYINALDSIVNKVFDIYV